MRSDWSSAEWWVAVRRCRPYSISFVGWRRTRRSTLVSGEPGTGKALAAQALHQLGPRANRPFVTVHCSAVVETLLESELFGHMSGAFAGAIGDKAGLFETADGGTIFLDEVGDVPLAVQAKLLRMIEASDVQRIGSVETRTVDVRLIVASSRDLRAEVGGGPLPRRSVPPT